MSNPTFQERRSAPVSWWIIGFAIGLSVAVALAAYYPQPIGLGILAAAVGGLAGALAFLSRTRIRVDADGLWVGGNHLDTAHLGQAIPLDREATSRRLGPRADARAALFTMPFLTQAVEVVVEDSRDPHPYWLVGTRQPQRLAAAINQLRESR